jgi:hypothetical protein
MMTQEEQKTKWAVRGEEWRLAGMSGSNKKLFPDSLRKRTSEWTDIMHNPRGDEESEHRKRDKKLQSKQDRGQNLKATEEEESNGDHRCYE